MQKSTVSLQGHRKLLNLSAVSKRKQIRSVKERREASHTSKFTVNKNGKFKEEIYQK